MANGERIVVVFEGRDAAGKGGTIKTLTEHLNPRGARSPPPWPSPTTRNAANGTSSATSSTCPRPARSCSSTAPGTTVPRSRARYGFCSREQCQAFLEETPEFERLLVKHGIRLVKYWFAVTREEQGRRFAKRRTDPLKRWKLSPIDLASVDKWHDYTEAREEMRHEPRLGTLDGNQVGRQEGPAQLHAAPAFAVFLPSQGSGGGDRCRPADPCPFHLRRLPGPELRGDQGTGGR